MIEMTEIAQWLALVHARAVKKTVDVIGRGKRAVLAGGEGGQHMHICIYIYIHTELHMYVYM